MERFHEICNFIQGRDVKFYFTSTGEMIAELSDAQNYMSPFPCPLCLMTDGGPGEGNVAIIIISLP
jgi:hypothetical protein